MDLKWVISEEERTRHDALFYSQKPKDQYLSGEQARSLFIRSKLPLPELSKIWKLADVTRNNTLDTAEFAIAMHLIQSRLKGTDIPEKLPESLNPVYLRTVDIPAMSPEEKEVYEKAFMWNVNSKTGFIDAEAACAILTGSGLPDHVLAQIWNLSDIDRDGKLSLEEFFVALHLTRYCKQGNSIEGLSINVRSILPPQLTDECYQSKRLRLAEVQMEKRKLLSLKEKLCLEIAGGFEESMAQKVQEELEQVERQVFVFEKEETELRLTLQQLKDKTKRESFKPFDRSFLLKRQPTGEDIFLGANKKYWSPLSDRKDVEILKLWREDGDLSDFGASICEEPSSAPVIYQNITQDQFGRTVIELTQSQESSSAVPPSSLSHPANDGNNNSVEAYKSQFVYSKIDNDEKFYKKQTEDTALTKQELEVEESGDKELNKKHLKHADKDINSSVIGSSPSQPATNGTFHQETENHIKPPPKRSLGDKETMYENRTDDEKSGSLQLEPKVYPYSEPPATTEKDKLLLSSMNGSCGAVDEAVQVSTAPTVQSSAASSKMDGLLLNLEEDGASFGNHTRSTSDAQSPRSPSGLTQEELIPFLMEEKKRKEEERAKQREIDEEMLKKARQEVYKQEEESRKAAEQRKNTFQEERKRLEQQMSLAQEGEGQKKAPLSRSEAGRIIEEELEQQRMREELTRIEIEKIKEKERLEIEKQKLIHAKKEEHPSAFQTKGQNQTAIFDEKLDAPDGGNFQGVRFSSKRGSVIDLSEEEGVSGPIKGAIENRPFQEPVFAPRPAPPQSQPQVQSQPQHQPVIRRSKDGAKPATGRNPEYRKSIVELEIERQKEREEEARREAEIARRVQSANQGRDKGPENKSEEVKSKDEHSRQVAESNAVAAKVPSVKKQTKKFEKRSEAFKATGQGPKNPVSGGLTGKTSAFQSRNGEETVVQQAKSTVVASSPVDEIDAFRQPVANGSGLEVNGLETEEERKRREEKELFRLEQEEEKRRREAQRQDLERIRKEVDLKEAEEMLRVKLTKEEEKKKQRETERKLAEERQKDHAETLKRYENDATSRKTAFAAHKLILEQRVLKALEESKQESTVPKRRASSFDRPSEAFEQGNSLGSERDEFSSGGVTLRKANFEKNGVRKDSKEELRKKRYSLNLHQTRRGINSLDDTSLGKDRVTKEAVDDVFVGRLKSQADVNTGGEQASEGKLSKAKSVGDLSFKKGAKNDEARSYPVLRRVSFNPDQTDSVDGVPSFSDSRIQKELEEQRLREEIVKQEVLEREKRHRLEEEKKKTVEVSAGKKEMSLNDIKRNPLPNKIQVKKPQSSSSNRDSLTHSMAAHWETVLQSVPDGKEAKSQVNKRKSVVELEKEEERRREDELQKERERVLLERRQKEEENKFIKQKKKEQEMERKRKEKEEKEKRQQRTTAMKSLFESKGAKN